MIAWLTARERWLPAAAGLLWWITFHPGFISEDSLINLTEARSGAMSVWFTAWWIYVIDALSLGTRAISLLTFIGAIGLEYATYFWIVTVFPKSAARTIAVLLICMSPLVGAMSIQVRHDVPLTAGLLIVAAILARRWNDVLTWRDGAWLAVAAMLIATRHNGTPTSVGAALIILIVFRSRWRLAIAMFGVAIVATMITFAATRASGNTATMHPVQTVEWLLADISCVISRGVEPTPQEWATLTRIAPRDSWSQSRACRFMNPTLTGRAADETAIVEQYRDLLAVWRSLAIGHPLEMTAAHATRVRLFLPPLPRWEVVSFLHSTIEPNEFGLHWTFPALAERARIIVRAWNALGVVLANAMIWLIAMIVIAWRVPLLRDRATPAIVIGAALIVGLLIAAPISEGRYALFILICGQFTVLHALLSSRARGNGY